MFRLGWSAEKCLDEINTGKGVKMSRKLVPYFKYVLPVLTLAVLIYGLL